jgi:hypothetical protein
MNEKKPNRRKASTQKLEPIDWREFANDAVLKGNMSTLYRRPVDEDPSAYASAEALAEIEKRVIPTVGIVPTVPPTPSVGPKPTVDLKPTAGTTPATPPTQPTVGTVPTVGQDKKRKVKAIRDVHDALTLAGQVLYKAMFGSPDDASSRSCTKGYRQLAAETRLDKDTVRDLIAEFKEKGILRETATYDPDTRSAKTYEVFSHEAVLQTWRDAGLQFVTSGRQRPVFCSADGQPLGSPPTVGTKPTDHS